MKRIVTALALSLLASLALSETRQTVSVAMVQAATACASKGSPVVGSSYSATLGVGSCVSADSSGRTVYVDFYTVAFTAGRTYRGAYSSPSIQTLITIQDLTTGAVLADGGGLFTSGSVTYRAPTSGTYVLGFGSYSTGGYTFSVTDITPVTPPPAPQCGQDITHLCLGSPLRFRVRVDFIANGVPGAATMVALTSDTGYAYFFSQSNVEVILKVVDGRAVNGKYWVFIGGLTNVDVTITITDTSTGAIRTYRNPQGIAFQPVQDTNGFN